MHTEPPIARFANGERFSGGQVTPDVMWKRRMKTDDPDLLGKLNALESFLISPDNQYGIIGDMVDGTVRPGAYAHIPLNSTLSLTVRIDEVKEIQLSDEQGQHKLLLFNQPDQELNDFLHAMNVGNEFIEIRISGED